MIPANYVFMILVVGFVFGLMTFGLYKYSKKKRK